MEKYEFCQSTVKHKGEEIVIHYLNRIVDPKFNATLYFNGRIIAIKPNTIISTDPTEQLNIIDETIAFLANSEVAQKLVFKYTYNEEIKEMEYF